MQYLLAHNTCVSKKWVTSKYPKLVRCDKAPRSDFWLKSAGEGIQKQGDKDKDKHKDDKDN